MSQIVERAYRFRFYSTKEQKEQLIKTFGCCRFIYNHFLDLRTTTWKEEKKSLSYCDCSSQLKDLKKENSWLKEISSVRLQQSLRHLDRAFDRFFKKESKYPKFKKRSYQQRATYMKNAFTFIGGKITLAKHKDPLNIKWTRKFKGEPTSLTITKDPSGKFYISILVKEEVSALPFKRGEIGLDLGLKKVVTDNHGGTVNNPYYLKKKEKLLVIRQKAFSRKKQGSKNSHKARKKVARAHEKVRDQRNDFLHKLSTKLVNENQVIAVETLRVKNMKKNKRLSKSIADTEWSTLIRFLEYKCYWYGKELVKVNPFYPSSKLCSGCGYKLETLDLATREWECPQCQLLHDRDKNAARNILREGLRQRIKQEAVPWGSRDLKPVEFV